MYEVAWKEFGRDGRICVRRRAFKTQKAMEKFIEKLWEKDNFYEVYGISEG